MSQFFPTPDEEESHNLVNSLNHKLDAILTLVQTILLKETAMAIDLTKLLAQAQAETTATASIMALCTSLSAELKTISGQLAGLPAVQAQIDDVANKLQTDAATVAASVLANTPAALPAP
jgi:chromosome segregation ATPase